MRIRYFSVQSGADGITIINGTPLPPRYPVRTRAQMQSSLVIFAYT
eukprot:SAG11_NODE_9482_length_907_cov_2.555693_2_plen_45_part_01